MNAPQYDIFSGVFDRDALWLEAVEGLGSSFERMKELASHSPGAYFVFCTRSHKVLASVDTSLSQDAQRENQHRTSA